MIERIELEKDMIFIEKEGEKTRCLIISKKHELYETLNNNLISLKKLEWHKNNSLPNSNK